MTERSGSVNAPIPVGRQSRGTPFVTRKDGGVSACFLLVLLVALAFNPSPSAAFGASAVAPAHLPYPVGGTTTVGKGINAGNSNAQLAETVPAHIRPGWRRQPPLCPSAANDALVSTSTAGKITLALDSQYQCSYVSAYRTSTGTLLWRKRFHFATAMVSDGTSVYVLRDSVNNGGDYIDALRIKDGKRRWIVPGSTSSREPNLAVGSGVVVNERQIINAATGTHRALRLPRSSGATFDGQALVAGKRIYYNSFGAVQAYSLTGRLLWSYRKAVGDVPGEGAALPQVHDGVVYITHQNISDQGSLALNAATGRLTTVLPASDAPLALDGRVGVFTTQYSGRPTTISAVDLGTRKVYWSRTFVPGPEPEREALAPESSAPVIENGLVWMSLVHGTDRPSVLKALDERTGTTRSTTVAPCNATPSNGAIGIAQHRIFAPSGCGLLTYIAR